MGTQGGDRNWAVADTFVELADTLTSDYHVGELLQFLVERTAAILEADAAGVFLEGPKGDFALTAATSEEMHRIEELEISADRGPSIDAYRSGEPVIVDDLAAATDRWPEVVPALVDMGMRGGYAFPLVLRGDRVGALNMYRRRPGRFERADIRIAQGFADLAAIGILQERKVADAERRAEHLQHALDSRIFIEQAKGVLANRHGITPGEAFEVLRRHARNERIRIHELSERVIEGLDLPPE